MTTDQHRIEIETRLTHLEDTVDQLSSTIAEQQDTIRQLKALLTRVVQDQNTLKSELLPPIGDAPPPHY